MVEETEIPLANKIKKCTQQGKVHSQESSLVHTQRSGDTRELCMVLICTKAPQVFIPNLQKPDIKLNLYMWFC